MKILKKINRVNGFYLIFALTVVAVRTWVNFFPLKKILIDGTIIHHFWVGMILFLLAFFLTKKHSGRRMGLFSVGLGLMADELIYMLLGAGPVSEYWSTFSVSGAIMMMAIIFLVRKKFVIKFL